MKHSIKIIFGKEQVNKFLADIQLSKEELEINTKVYSFETEAELVAFKIGVNETVGWMECYMIDNVLCEG